MQVHTGNSLRADINVTPMIDVLLVLLVIFMVVTPLTSQGLEASVPQEAQNGGPQPGHPLVLSMAADGTLDLTSQRVTTDELPARLASLARLRPHGVVFVRGAGSLNFQDVAGLLDTVRGAGLTPGLMTR